MSKRDIAGNRRREILESFYQVARTEGVQAASLAKIAKRMGVHHSLLIHYFQTKENMTIELIDFMFEKLEVTFIKRWDAIEDPWERVNVMLDVLFSSKWVSILDDTVFYACYVLALRNTRVRDHLMKAYASKFRNYLIREMERLEEAGIIKHGDFITAADIIISIVEGIDFYRHICVDASQIDKMGPILKEMTLAVLMKRSRRARR